MQDLGHAKIVRSQRGLHGGFTLVREPRDLTILEVVNSVDAFYPITRCPLGKPGHTSGLCPLHQRIDNVMTAAEKALDHATIVELLLEPKLLCCLPCISEPVELEHAAM